MNLYLYGLLNITIFEFNVAFWSWWTWTTIPLADLSVLTTFFGCLQILRLFFISKNGTKIKSRGSFMPNLGSLMKRSWVLADSNHWHLRCKLNALTNWAKNSYGGAHSRTSGKTGVEPATFDVTNRRSNQLSYLPFMLLWFCYAFPNWANFVL